MDFQIFDDRFQPSLLLAFHPHSSSCNIQSRLNLNLLTSKSDQIFYFSSTKTIPYISLKPKLSFKVSCTFFHVINPRKSCNFYLQHSIHFSSHSKKSKGTHHKYRNGQSIELSTVTTSEFHKKPT